MAWMLEELGNPQDNLKAVHIVGTNGKGSTVNALQMIFLKQVMKLELLPRLTLLILRNGFLSMVR